MTESVPLTDEDPPYVDAPVDEGKNPEHADAAPDDWPRTGFDKQPIEDDGGADPTATSDIEGGN